MKMVIQYVSQAQVVINHKQYSQINEGYLVLVGFGDQDTKKTCRRMSQKLLSIRTIPDENGKINHSIRDIDGDILIVPQFTLYANLTRGHRPSFSSAASPEKAKKLFAHFKSLMIHEYNSIKTGKFGANMQVSLINQGPITIIV